MAGAQRYEAEFGWGLEGGRDGMMWEPFLGLQGSGTVDFDLRMGLNLTSDLNLGLEFGWPKQTLAEEPTGYTVGIQDTISW